MIKKANYNCSVYGCHLKKNGNQQCISISILIQKQNKAIVFEQNDAVPNQT